MPKYNKPRRTAENDKFHNYKVCTACNENKRLTDFHLSTRHRKFRAADPRRYASQCRECRKMVQGMSPTAKRHRTGEPYDAKSHRQAVRRNTKIKIFEYMAERGCHRCGYKDPRALEFFHRDPASKRARVSRFVSSCYAWKSPQLQKEISRCDVSCANCRRVRTTKQQEYYADPKVAAHLSEILAEHGYEE